MRELAHVVVSEVRERGQGGKEQRDVVVAVLDEHVGKGIDKQEPPMREDLLLSSETAMASRQSVTKAVPSVPPSALSVSRLEAEFHHPRTHPPLFCQAAPSPVLLPISNVAFHLLAGSQPEPHLHAPHISAVLSPCSPSRKRWRD